MYGIETLKPKILVVWFFFSLFVVESGLVYNFIYVALEVCAPKTLARDINDSISWFTETAVVTVKNK